MAVSITRAAAVFGVVAALGLAACGRDEARPAFRSVDITGAEYARVLKLPQADGKAFNLADQTGKVSIVFFGFTQCPDVCPATLAELAAVKKQLGPLGDKVQGIFVTLDPERDTPAMLSEYMASFGPGFIALRGSPEDIKATSREFKILAMKVPGRKEGQYTVDHTAASFVFDQQARVRLFVRYGAPTDALVSDLKLLLAE